MFILTARLDLSTRGHYFDHSEDGVHGDPGPGEVYDSVLGNSVAFVGDGDEVVDFVDGPCMSSSRASCKDVRHSGLGFQEPAHSSIEVLFRE